MNNFKGLNRNTHITKVNLEGKEVSFLLTKVLVPTLLYFNNDQNEIRTNVTRFGVTVSKVKDGRDGVTFTKKEGCVIVTIGVWNAYKPANVQFLIRSGLTIPALHEAIADKKYSRFKPVLRYLEHGLMLSTELPVDSLLDLLKQIEDEGGEVEGDNVPKERGIDVLHLEKVGDPNTKTKSLTVKKPRAVGITEVTKRRGITIKSEHTGTEIIVSKDLKADNIKLAGEGIRYED